MRFFPPLMPLSLCLGAATLCGTSAPLLAQNRTAQTPQKRAIVSALTKEFNHATADHVKVAVWRLTRLETRGAWALAGVKPSASSQLDPITVLLHQQRGTWKVVTLGTNLRGSGTQFGVPRALWKRWDLG